MKRGLLRAYLDLNKGLQKQHHQHNDLKEKKRRPSRIEERIRIRKLRVNNNNNNNIQNRIKSPVSFNVRSSNVNEAAGNDNSNSCDSTSSPRTNSINSTNSCCSSISSSENFTKNRDSKQRVDLLELHASNRNPIIVSHINAAEEPDKINNEKLGSLQQVLGSPKIKARAKSAPCTPLFQIKCAKNVNNNCNRNWGGLRNFVDCKIVEKDCIAVTGGDQLETRIEDEVADEDQPIGNPALISVMKESLGEIEEDLEARKSRQEFIINQESEDPLQGEKFHSLNSSSNEIGENLVPQEPEVPLKASGSIELRSNECSTEIGEEGERLSANLKNQEPNYGPSCMKTPKKCHCNIFHRAIRDSNFTDDQGTEISCRSNDFGEIRILNGCRKSTCSSNAIRDHRPSSVVEKCEMGKNRRYEKLAPLLKDAEAYPGLDDSIVSSGNSVEGNNCRAKSRGCFFCAKFNNSRSKFETAVTDCDIPSLRIEPRKPIGKYHSISKSSWTSVPIRSCNYYNHQTAGKCCSKISAHRSKSSPRRVTFCLPELIPEEESSCSGGEAKILESCSVRGCKFGRCVRCSGRIELGQNYSGELEMREFTNSVIHQDSKTKFGRISSRRSNFQFHKHNCGGNFKHKSRSPRVHFCREIMSKHQDIVRGDILPDHKEQSRGEFPRNSESKTSITSDKDEWVDSGAEENSNSFDNVSFPKETRQAMNVLMMQSRVKNRQNGENSNGLIPGQKLPLKEIKASEKQDLGIFVTPGHKAMVASYAQALAVFQKTCDPLQEAGGSCKKKRHIVWKGSDGEIHSGLTSPSELTLQQKIVKRVGNNREEKKRIRNSGYLSLSFLDNKSNPNSSRNLNNVPKRPTGLKMQTNGSDNGSSENGVDRTGWTVGLINGRFKYLTAETFGFKINANGASLKKKQLWTLEGSEHQVFLRSHLDRYLAVDQFGNVTCEAEDTADPGCAFQIQVASDGSGRWALKNIQRGYFLGSSQDELKCTAKVPGDAEYWLVHLAARPQVNLRSAGRKRFAHLSAAQDEIHVDAPVPWGEDTLFTLEFRPSAVPDNVDGNSDARREVRSEAGIGGHYALHTCNNKYLARDGKLLDSCTRDCLYAAEFHAGMLALRDVSGAYLAPIGSKAVLKSRSNTVTRDELFSLEDSLPQASFVAALNQRYVSVKQGVDVTANQDEISGHETFQLEFDRATKRWYLRTMQDRYWTLEAGGGIQASDHKRSSNALFDLVWQPADGTVALRANNGKFLATKRSGHLYANADSPGDSEASKFYFYLMNRPVLVLRCEQGFVGLKSNASPKLECNKASYETIRVERCDRGIVRFKGQNGKYWHADSEGVTSDADVPSDGFYLELREPSRICIKSTDGRYLSAGKNGVFRLGDTDYESATKWEF